MQRSIESISIRRSFLWARLTKELQSEDQCIEFLRRVLESLDARILDYRSTDAGKFHGIDERGKDLIVQFNSFVNAVIGIQIKFHRGLTKEATESEMAGFEAQIRRAANRKYRLNGNRIRLTKVYLVLFGGAKESARDYFTEASENIGIPCELWTTDRLIELIVDQSNWPRISEYFSWQSEFDLWYELHRQTMLGKLTYEVQRYSPELRIPLGSSSIHYRPESIPQGGFFLSAFDAEHALVYRGYRSELRLLSDLKLNRHVKAGAVPIIKVVGRSGIGKTSFLRAGLFHELILSTRTVEFIPLVVRCSSSWKSIDDLRTAVRAQARRIGVEHEVAVLKDGGITPIIVLDQFEDILGDSTSSIETFSFAIATAREIGAHLILGVREDYLYEANVLLATVAESERISIDHEDLYLRGLSRTEVEQFLIGMKSDQLLAIKDRVILYLWPRNSRLPHFDPARLQILIHFLLFLGTEGQELALADERVLANFENLYLSAILSKHVDLKPLILTILLRYGISQSEGGRISRRSFTRGEINSGVGESPAACEKALATLIERRVLIRMADSSNERFELAHDRLAENLVFSFPDIFAELETVRDIEATITRLERGECEVPGSHTVRQWLQRLGKVVDSAEASDLSAQVLHAVQILDYSFGSGNEPFPLVRGGEVALSKPFLLGLIAAAGDTRTLARFIRYLGRNFSADLLDAAIERMRILSAGIPHAIESDIREFLSALCDYQGVLTPGLLTLISGIDPGNVSFWKSVASALQPLLARHAARNNTILVEQEGIDETVLLDISRHLSPARSLVEGACCLLKEDKHRWRACRTLADYAQWTEVHDIDMHASVKNLCETQLLKFLGQSASGTNPGNSSRELYYAFKTLAFLRSQAAKETARKTALESKDYRIRRVAGALYIKVANIKEIRALVDLLMESVPRGSARRGGDGGEAYRLRQTLFEVLQMVWDQRLGIPNDVKSEYAVYLRERTSSRLAELDRSLRENATLMHSGELRNPDKIDEDLITLLVLLLGATGLWGNLDLFLRTLREPICSAGTYDIPEAGLVAISKLCISTARGIDPISLVQVKDALRVCMSHRHNGVSGRAVKVLQWIGGGDDIPLLESLESHTVKNLRESSLLAREGIFKGKSESWGHFFDSDQFVRIWG